MRYTAIGLLASTFLTSGAAAQFAWYSVDVTTEYDMGAVIEALQVPAFVQPSWGGPLDRVEIQHSYSAELRFTSSEPLTTDHTVMARAGLDFSFGVDGTVLRDYSFRGDLFPHTLSAGFESPGPWIQAVAGNGSTTFGPASPIFSDFLGPADVQLDVDRSPEMSLFFPPDYIGIESRSIMTFTVTYYFVPTPSAAGAALLTLGLFGRRRRGN